MPEINIDGLWGKGGRTEECNSGRMKLITKL
jgi:hypothetical protein